MKLKLSPRLLLALFLGCLLLSIFPKSQVSAQAGRPITRMLIHDHKHDKPTPSLIVDNLEFLENERSFIDGIFVRIASPGTLGSSFDVMNAGSDLDYQTVANEVAPMKNLQSTTLKHFLAVVFDMSAPHLDDDAGWDRIAQNWANFAKAIKEANFKGIAYDNEAHGTPWSHHPSHVCSESLQVCSDKARARGRQVMEAIKVEFPNIVMLHFHGPSISEPDAPEYVSGTPYIVFPSWQHANQLKGPFFVGMMEGMAPGAKMVDGGELYMLRDEVGFGAAYNFQKYEIASDRVDCIFIPPSLRPSYPDKVSPCYGIYDVAYKGSPMSSSIYYTTILLALQHADDYIWVYPNRFTFLTPTSNATDLEWIDSARRAKEDYMAGVPTEPPTSPTPTPPGPICFGINNTIDADDVMALVVGYLGGGGLPDTNGDGRINSFELGYLVLHWGENCQ